MTTQFTDPAPPAGPQFADPAPAPGKIKRDRYGRYVLPHPDTGVEQAWTRVTTLAGTLEDAYNVHQWELRSAVKGMALRPDLVALAANLDVSDDKDEMNRLARDAKAAAGGSSGANMGTALHKMTEKVDAGEKVVIPESMAGDLQAYRDTLARENVRVDPAYLERVVCVPELGVVGTLDKLLDQGPGLPYQVADLKSQKSMDFGGLKIAVQQAVYAHAYAVWDPVAQKWEDPPELDQVLATIIWLPVGRGICELFDVDLCLGWEWAQLSARVRGIRKAKPVTRRESMVPVPGPVSQTISESGINTTNFPANATSQAQMVAPSTERATVGAPPGSWSGPDPQVPGDASPPPDPYKTPEAWAEVFRDATTVEDLTQAGQAAALDFGGQLPDSLKALGRELRAKLTEHAPAA